jgi:hypothetical protein
MKVKNSLKDVRWESQLTKCSQVKQLWIERSLESSENGSTSVFLASEGSAAITGEETGVTGGICNANSLLKRYLIKINGLAECLPVNLRHNHINKMLCLLDILITSYYNF